MKQNWEPNMDDWSTVHMVIAAILALAFLGVFGLNLFADGRSALPWDVAVLTRHDVQFISLTVSIFFAVAIAGILVGLATCITGLLLGPKRKEWILGLIAVNFGFALVADIATYAEVYFSA